MSPSCRIPSWNTWSRNSFKTSVCKSCIEPGIAEWYYEIGEAVLYVERTERQLPSRLHCRWVVTSMSNQPEIMMIGRGRAYATTMSRAQYSLRIQVFFFASIENTHGASTSFVRMRYIDCHISIESALETTSFVDICRYVAPTPWLSGCFGPRGRPRVSIWP